MTPLTIVADQHVWGVHSAFSTLPGYEVDLRVMEQGEITPTNVADADILLVRSSTKVNADLLQNSRVRFVATATVGDDHIDLNWLKQQKIAFASAAGSSTDSVVEYLTAVLFALHCEYHINLPQAVLGVVGVGRIGSRVAARAEALGMSVMRNDPPLAAQDSPTDWQPLDALLQQADILTLHTPLLRDGANRTLHLLDEAAFNRFQGRVVINAARGAVVDHRALLAWLAGDDRRLAVLDCWEGEPHISRELLAHPQLIIATPHIAGHSLDGKAANTQYVYDALCAFLGVDGDWHMDHDLTDPEVLLWSADDGADVWQQVARMIHALYPLVDDVAACRALLDHAEDARFAAGFIHYRRHYPVRRSWQRSPFAVAPSETALAALAHRAGVVLCNR
ncbi:MAG: 4-phosphoerythronate dehydrogenase [Mariprofundales bacterium]